LVRARRPAVHHLFLEHQHHVGDLIGRMQPAHQQRGGDVVRQVGHDTARRRAERGGLDRERVTFDHLEAAP